MASAVLGADAGGAGASKEVRALQALHAHKTRALMKSIDALRAQVDALKAAGSESRRTAMIQALRKEKREQELIVDVLKAELGKTGGSALSAAEVDDLVIKRTLGGPKRFRPKTREELAVELRKVQSQLQRAESKLSKASEAPGKAVRDPFGATGRAGDESMPTAGDECANGGKGGGGNQGEGDESKVREEHDSASSKRVAELLDVIEQQKIDLLARERSSKAYTETIDRMRHEAAEHAAARDKLERLTAKYGRIKATARQTGQDLLELQHKHDELGEQHRRAQLDLAAASGDHAKCRASDHAGLQERLALLDQVNELKAREVTLMDEVDQLRVQLADAKQRVFAKKGEQASAQQMQAKFAHDLAAAQAAAAEAQAAARDERTRSEAALNAEIERLETELEEAKAAAAMAAAKAPHGGDESMPDFGGADGGDEAMPGQEDDDEPRAAGGDESEEDDEDESKAAEGKQSEAQASARREAEREAERLAERDRCAQQVAAANDRAAFAESACIEMQRRVHDLELALDKARAEVEDAVVAAAAGTAASAARSAGDESFPRARSPAFAQRGDESMPQQEQEAQAAQQRDSDADSDDDSDDSNCERKEAESKSGGRPSSPTSGASRLSPGAPPPRRSLIMADQETQMSPYKRQDVSPTSAVPQWARLQSPEPALAAPGARGIESFPASSPAAHMNQDVDALTQQLDEWQGQLEKWQEQLATSQREMADREDRLKWEVSEAYARQRELELALEDAGANTERAAKQAKSSATLAARQRADFAARLERLAQSQGAPPAEVAQLRDLAAQELRQSARTAGGDDEKERTEQQAVIRVLRVALERTRQHTLLLEERLARVGAETKGVVPLPRLAVTLGLCSTSNVSSSSSSSSSYSSSSSSSSSSNTSSALSSRVTSKGSIFSSNSSEATEDDDGGSTGSAAQRVRALQQHQQHPQQYTSKSKSPPSCASSQSAKSALHSPAAVRPPRQIPPSRASSKSSRSVESPVPARVSELRGTTSRSSRPPHQDDEDEDEDDEVRNPGLAGANRPLGSSGDSSSDDESFSIARIKEKLRAGGSQESGSRHSTPRLKEEEDDDGPATRRRY